MKTAAYYIGALDLQPHPEGGYFAETYRSTETVPPEALPHRFGGARSFGTAIYFLLERHQMSALHRIQSDEIWHFYGGDALEISVIFPDGELISIRLGNNPDQGEVFQAVVPAGCWFGSTPIVESAIVESTIVNSTVDSTMGAGFSLVGCTVAPGFDFADFEMGDQNFLLSLFPQHYSLIRKLTT